MSLSSSVVVRGFLGTDPKSFTANGVAGSSFRLASSRSYYDRKSQQWKDSPTTWVSVRAFRGLAVNVNQALSKGDPVVVVGELVTDEWNQDGARRTALALQASVIGHDLNQGVSKFMRTHSARSASTQPSEGQRSGSQASMPSGAESQQSSSLSQSEGLPPLEVVGVNGEAPGSDVQSSTSAEESYESGNRSSDERRSEEGEFGRFVDSGVIGDGEGVGSDERIGADAMKEAVMV